MQQDYENILQLINNSDTSLDLLKNTCEAFLDTYCNQEGMVLYSDLIRKIADKESIEIES
jgi:hypothetical protein